LALLHDLIVDLRRLPPLDRTIDDMARMLTQASAASLERPLVTRPDGYTRTCAYDDERFEVLLLNWARGAASSIHDHGGQHCWLVVLEGELRIDDYVRVDSCDVPGYALVEPRGSRTMKAGGLDLRSGPFDIHRVAQSGSAGAVSLHVYSRPLRDFLVYDERARRCSPGCGEYDDVLL
jgi:cysteine dioxygenase